MSLEIVIFVIGHLSYNKQVLVIKRIKAQHNNKHLVGAWVYATSKQLLDEVLVISRIIKVEVGGPLRYFIL